MATMIARKALPSLASCHRSNPSLSSVRHLSSIKSIRNRNNHIIDESPLMTNWDVRIVPENKIVDPKQVSCSMGNPLFSVSNVTRLKTVSKATTEINLDVNSKENDAACKNIANAINADVEKWGMQCLRFEIKDITPSGARLNVRTRFPGSEKDLRREAEDSNAKVRAEVDEQTK